MASTQPEAEDLVPRYLAGQLTPAESEAFERALSERAELRDQTEQALKLKEGLARLHERGELDALLRAPARPRWLPYAAAAAVAMISLATLAWLYLPRSASSLLALSPQQLASGQRPLPVVGSYVLARMRGTAPVTELGRAGVVELRVLPSMLSSAVSYRAQIRTGDGTVRGRVVGEVDAGRAAADGYVTLYLDAGQLPPGDYEVSLSPSTAGPDAQADRFPLRLR
jgi:hypothetical protein